MARPWSACSSSRTTTMCCCRATPLASACSAWPARTTSCSWAATSAATNATSPTGCWTACPLAAFRICTARWRITCPIRSLPCKAGCDGLAWLSLPFFLRRSRRARRAARDREAEKVLSWAFSPTLFHAMNASLQQTAAAATAQAVDVGDAEYLKRINTARVYDVALETPLMEAAQLGARLGNRVFLKREDMQPVHSFKLRGAYNRMARLSLEERRRGVICASAGNHAQGVALAGQKLGLRAVIVMPRTTPPIKVQAVAAYGGEIVLHGDSYDEASAHAAELQARDGLVYVHPYDDPD